MGGYDQDEGARQRDERNVASGCFLTARRNPPEARELADILIDPGATLVENLWKAGRPKPPLSGSGWNTRLEPAAAPRALLRAR